MPDHNQNTLRTFGQKLWSVLAHVLLVLAGFLSGAVLGGLYVKLFVSRAAMGWDGIANALGGLMLGGLTGIVVSILLARVLVVKRRLQLAGVLFAAVLLVIAWVIITREPRLESKPIVREQPFQPPFLLRMNVGHTDEILRAVKPGQEPLPFTEARVWSAIPELEFTGWGPDFDYCIAEPTRGDMSQLVPLVTAATTEGRAGSCLTPERDDLGINFNFTLDGERVGGAVQQGCLPQRPGLLALSEAVAELAGRLCAPSRPQQ